MNVVFLNLDLSSLIWFDLMQLTSSKTVWSCTRQKGFGVKMHLSHQPKSQSGAIAERSISSPLKKKRCSTFTLCDRFFTQNWNLMFFQDWNTKCSPDRSGLSSWILHLRLICSMFCPSSALWYKTSEFGQQNFEIVTSFYRLKPPACDVELALSGISICHSCQVNVLTLSFECHLEVDSLSSAFSSGAEIQPGPVCEQTLPGPGEDREEQQKGGPDPSKDTWLERCHSSCCGLLWCPCRV